MAAPFLVNKATDGVKGKIDLFYLFRIAATAALGGLLFGYDWVVIGGAKHFYEIYFHLTSDWMIGWASSCALLGCLAGSLMAGVLSDRIGRKGVLIASAMLFVISSVLTGWAYIFSTFILWRIGGGVAIGLVLYVAPTYIAEISTASSRGRLVSLNQLAIVAGIFLGQIVNWLIADKIGHANETWNIAHGWRWMFTALAVPSTIFFLLAVFLPESPRWLCMKDRICEAREILSRIGGKTYASTEISAMISSNGPATASQTSAASSFLPVRADGA